MVNYILKRELIGNLEFPKNNGEGLIYSIQIRYGNYNLQSEEIVFDQENSACYQNFIDFSSMQRFLEIIRKRNSPSKLFPLIELTVEVQSVTLPEYPHYDPSTLYPIVERKKVNGKTLEDKIYEYPQNQFIRNPFFCDIIKGYDYEVF